MLEAHCMTLTDYLINGLFIGLVVRQLRGRRLTTFSIVMPVAAVAFFANEYLHGIPTAGNDLSLALLGASLGLLLGLGCGLTTRVYAGSGGGVFVQAGAVAAALWIVGVGSRLAFSLYVMHGGERAIGRFSAAHGISSGNAWVACLILMAFGEVLGRTAVLAWRWRRQAAIAVAAPAGPATASLALSSLSAGDYS
jgi:hypothetical protein